MNPNSELPSLLQHDWSLKDSYLPYSYGAGLLTVRYLPYSHNTGPKQSVTFLTASVLVPKSQLPSL